MMRYAKSKRGSKSKRKGAKNTGHPVAQWRRANPAFVTRRFIDGKGPAGEFSSAVRTNTAGGSQHAGHVHLAGCECLSRADWNDNYSEAYKASVAAEKARLRRIADHEAHGAKCAVHFMLLSVSGECPECN